MVDRLIPYLRMVGRLCLLGTALPYALPYALACAARVGDGRRGVDDMLYQPLAQWMIAGAAPESVVNLQLTGTLNGTLTNTGTIAGRNAVILSANSIAHLSTLSNATVENYQFNAKRSRL